MKDKMLTIGVLAAFGVMVIAMMLLFAGIPPFDMVVTAGDTESGRVVSIEQKEFIQGPPSMLPPDIHGIYKVSIDTGRDTIERVIDSKVLSQVPQVGDHVEGRVYLTKTRFESEWHAWQPYKSHTFPDYSYAWIEANIK